jgi:betaine-aldehyde dehydrogenase
VKVNGTSVLDLSPDSTQSFWAGSGIGGHGNADLVRFFTGTRIVGADLPDAPI